MPSKYEDVIKRLSAEPQSSAYQNKVDACKRELRDGGKEFDGLKKFKVTLASDSPPDLGRAYAELRDAKELLEETLKSVDLAITALVQMVDSRFEADGLGSVKIKGIGAVDARREPCTQVTDKEAFRKWCIENGMEDSLALNAQTRDSLVKQRLLEGLPEPEGIKVFWRPKVVLRRE